MGLNTENNENIKINKDSSFTKFLNKFLSRTENHITCENNILDEEGLIECIEKARNDWTNAIRDFEYAEDEEIVDYYTYKIKACQVRYEYFLKIAKRKGITCK
ncbi:DUF2508 family protein [Herbivorax sp. ANBcel31]|uniref:DUF2508 family protein n=1 Tax=Herbivorax sp. ANBcel31 TaxID=3069754 RepID=UPI0027B8143A|nr:DUF2508 family protein [Herbivorax sp. ANBcel31]MDQ2086032.1 DUF2508 family protein [Herbivorax sp. ANBcel31]